MHILYLSQHPKQQKDTSIVIKISLSEIESMEIDEDGSHKKAKLFQGGEILNEEIYDGF